jgi:demethylmenaquinone methyltransferase/2-methoxy-6-polyprenyl-1,4-benzoquinol methylase
VTDARPRSRVLDVATGTGEQAFAFAQRGHEVVGIDLSEDMLRVAREHNKYSRVTFDVGDAAHMPYEDDQFDVSCVSFALHDMPRSIGESVVKEMARVTKANGIIIIVDYAVPAKNLLYSLFLRIARLGETKYFPEFVQSGLTEVLKTAGIRIIVEVPILAGIGRISKAINKKGGAN